MIIHYQTVELLGKTIFERVVFHPPLKATELMENEACLIYSFTGTSILYGEEKSESLKEEESVLMKCGSFINHWQVSDSEPPFEAIAVHFYPDVLKLAFEHQVPDYLLQSINHQHKQFQKITSNSILKAYMDSLLMYFNNQSLFSSDIAQLKLKELVALLYQLDSHGVREILSDLFNPHHAEFKQVIKEHLFHDLSLEDLAYLMNLSLSSFKRRFKEIYQTAPGQYIRQKRLEQAAKLLSTTSLKVSEICYDCGFGDVSNFTRAFSKVYGVTPSAYQEQQLS